MNQLQETELRLKSLRGEYLELAQAHHETPTVARAESLASLDARIEGLECIEYDLRGKQDTARLLNLLGIITLTLIIYLIH